MAAVYGSLTGYADAHDDQDNDLTGRDLIVASRLVRMACCGYRYSVDGDGLPTDAAVLAALTEATYETLAAWSQAAEGNGLAGVRSASLASASYTLDGAAVKTLDRATPQLPYAAWLVLRDAGMVGGPVYVDG